MLTNKQKSVLVGSIIDRMVSVPISDWEAITESCIAENEKCYGMSHSDLLHMLKGCTSVASSVKEEKIKNDILEILSGIGCPI